MIGICLCVVDVHAVLAGAYFSHVTHLDQSCTSQNI